MNRHSVPLLLVLIFLSATISATGQTAVAPQTPNLVLTHASAHRRLPNTIADVSLSIETEASNTAAVSKALATRSQALIAFLKHEGADRLATVQVSLEPKIHTAKGGPDQIVGYSGTLVVTFRSTPDKISDLITGALTHGANTLQGVSFAPREEEVTTARQELAIEATRTALAQAEAVAKAAGERITELREISVDPGNTSIYQPRAMQMMDMARSNGSVAPPPPIATEAGDQDVSLTVNLQAILAH